MNDLQKDLLELRQKIAKAMRAELMGPGSEVSYPDEEHELISEYPSERYSVGILYPKEQKFGDNDAVSEDEDTGEFEDDIASEEEALGDDNTRRAPMYKDDSFDDEVNLSQQNKPSSMGFTFFVSKNIETVKINVDYAKYVIADDKEIEIPFPYDDLHIPDCLTAYISFNKDTKTIKKLRQKGSITKI